MAKIRYGARSLRLELQHKEARQIPMQEVAEATGLDRSRINKIELGMVREIKPDELVALCAYYSEKLGRLVDTNEIMGYDPNNTRALDLAVA